MGLRISLGLGPIRVSAGTRGIYGSVGAGPVRVGGRLAGSSRRRRGGGTGYSNAAIINAQYQRQVREYRRALVHQWADRIYAAEDDQQNMGIRQVMAWTEECAFVRNAALLGQIASEERAGADDGPWSDMRWSYKVVLLEQVMREALPNDFDMDRSPTEGKRLYGARAWVWFTKSGRMKRRPYLHLW